MTSNGPLGDPNGNTMFLPLDGNNAGGSFDELEVQLFTPLPPYLVQAQQTTAYIPDGTADMAAVDGVSIMDTTNGFTNIFGVDEWNEMLTVTDQSGFRPQYGGVAPG